MMTPGAIISKDTARCQRVIESLECGIAWCDPSTYFSPLMCSSKYFADLLMLGRIEAWNGLTQVSVLFGATKHVQTEEQ